MWSKSSWGNRGDMVWVNWGCTSVTPGRDLAEPCRTRARLSHIGMTVSIDVAQDRTVVSKVLETDRRSGHRIALVVRPATTSYSGLAWW